MRQQPPTGPNDPDEHPVPSNWSRGPAGRGRVSWTCVYGPGRGHWVRPMRSIRSSRKRGDGVAHVTIWSMPVALVARPRPLLRLRGGRWRHIGRCPATSIAASASLVDPSLTRSIRDRRPGRSIGRPIDLSGSTIIQTLTHPTDPSNPFNATPTTEAAGAAAPNHRAAQHGLVAVAEQEQLALSPRPQAGKDGDGRCPRCRGGPAADDPLVERGGPQRPLSHEAPAAALAPGQAGGAGARAS